MSTAAQPRSQADFLKGEPHRKHPGVINLKTLRLPEELQTAARSIIHSKLSRVCGHLLTNFLWSRKRAVEDTALRQKAVSMEKELWEKALQKKGEITKTTKYIIIFQISAIIVPICSFFQSYQIKKRDPTFAPQSLLDFGSGLGTVVWASHSCWADSLKEMVCVDSSGPMNILAEQLLKGDDDRAQPLIKHVYFRQFLPVSPKVQFDLVVAAFTLSELPNVKEREEAVLTLWRKTSSYLVLVENGTKEGHHILMEARDTLLKKQEKIIYDSRPASVFAPCPHELMCPKLALEPTVPCNFQQLYQPLPLPGHNERQIEKFSFLILTRSGPAETTGGVDWARLVAPVLRKTRHVHCRMCCPNGQLQHVVVTARKHSRDVYRCARSSDWGDQLPVIQRLQEDAQSDSE
uniref:Methyltransferase like 17 n=1 Tax=Echeneis naucrates TaxID=173247 RepID=A0A665UAL2_ECHNA